MYPECMRDIKYILIFFIIFSLIFFNFTYDTGIDYKLFLTISTFLFAIFCGFLIARQGTRYSSIRDMLTKFDGNMSYIYRASGHFGEKVQKDIGEILIKHYTPIFEQNAWHYSFTHKTTTLTDIHSYFQKVLGGRKLPSMQHIVINQTAVALRESQGLRKNMIALYEERVPRLQWFLLEFLVLTIMIDLFIIPSQMDALSSLLKGAFGSILIFILVFLRELDSLEFFETGIGEGSARDVLDIIEGKK
jgi:hypothetical protein